MISPGAVVLVNKQGNVAFVVEARAPGGRWRVVCKSIDPMRGAAFTGMTVGEGDLTLVKDAPVFEPGATVRYEGVDHAVVEDRGATITLSVPASRFVLGGGGALHVPSGNTAVINKSDLVLEALT